MLTGHGDSNLNLESLEEETAAEKRRRSRAAIQAESPKGLSAFHRTSKFQSLASFISFLFFIKKPTEPATTHVQICYGMRLPSPLYGEELMVLEMKTYRVPDRKFPSRWVLLDESDGLGMSMKGDMTSNTCKGPMSSALTKRTPLLLS